MNTTATATFPPHLYFALLSAVREFRVPGCFVDMVQDTGVATFTGRRPQVVSAGKAQFEQVVRRLQREDLAKAQAHAEEGTTPGPVYEPVRGAVSLPTSSHSPKVVASYSWNMADPDEPYAIPGHLSTFSKPETPLSLAADDGGAHDPLSWETARGMATAMEPIVVACCALDPTFSLSACQVVTDRNNLRKIFRWACGDRSRWRIDLEKVAPDTIAMLRFDLSEEGQSELLQRKRSGYRFEDLCCAGDDGRASASSDSYRAVLEFETAGIRFLMRCEIDAAMAPQESDELLELQLAQLSLAARPLKLAGSELVFQRSAWPKAPEFVELTSMIDQRFEHPRDLKEMKDKWFQAYLAGVHTTVFGLKPARDKMVVESTVELSPSELLQWFKAPTPHHNVVQSLMNLYGALARAKEFNTCGADGRVKGAHGDDERGGLRKGVPGRRARGRRAFALLRTHRPPAGSSVAPTAGHCRSGLPELRLRTAILRRHRRGHPPGLTFLSRRKTFPFFSLLSFVLVSLGFLRTGWSNDMKCSGVRVAVMSMLLAVVATSLAVAEKEHCSLAQELEEEAVLLERHQDVVHHHPESEHTTTNAAEPQQAQKPGRLTEKQRQQKREQRQALKESVVAVMRAQEQAFEAQRDELEANNDNYAGEPEFDLVLGDMQLKMARLAQQEQEDPRLRLNYALSVPVPAFKEKKVEAKGQKVGWGGSLEVPAQGMESRGSWSWGWSKSSSQGGGGKTSRPRADS